jgi:hypothetical protein
MLNIATLQLQHSLLPRKILQVCQEAFHLILANLVAFQLKEVVLKSLEASHHSEVQAHSHVEKLAL